MYYLFTLAKLSNLFLSQLLGKDLYLKDQRVQIHMTETSSECLEVIYKYNTDKNLR